MKILVHKCGIDSKINKIISSKENTLRERERERAKIIWEIKCILNAIWQKFVKYVALLKLLNHALAF